MKSIDVKLDCVQWTGNNFHDVDLFVPNQINKNGGALIINTSGFNHSVVFNGDWIFKTESDYYFVVPEAEAKYKFPL